MGNTNGKENKGGCSVIKFSYEKTTVKMSSEILQMNILNHMDTIRIVTFPSSNECLNHNLESMNNDLGKKNIEFSLGNTKYEGKNSLDPTLSIKNNLFEEHNKRTLLQVPQRLYDKSQNEAKGAKTANYIQQPSIKGKSHQKQNQRKYTNKENLIGYCGLIYIFATLICNINFCQVDFADPISRWMMPALITMTFLISQIILGILWETIKHSFLLVLIKMKCSCLILLVCTASKTIYGYFRFAANIAACFHIWRTCYTKLQKLNQRSYKKVRKFYRRISNAMSVTGTNFLQTLASRLKKCLKYVRKSLKQTDICYLDMLVQLHHPTAWKIQIALKMKFTLPPFSVVKALALNELTPPPKSKCKQFAETFPGITCAGGYRWKTPYSEITIFMAKIDSQTDTFEGSNYNTNIDNKGHFEEGQQHVDIAQCNLNEKQEHDSLISSNSNERGYSLHHPDPEPAQAFDNVMHLSDYLNCCKDSMEHKVLLVNKIAERLLSSSGKFEENTDYEVCRKISEGGYGQVFLCKTTRYLHDKGKDTNEIVLKKIPWSKFNTTEVLIPFLYSSTRPEILEIYVMVVEDRHVKIFMEYAQGGSFEDFRQKNWTVADIKTIMQRLLQCIANLHEEQVVHFDLKDKNIGLRYKHDPSSLVVFDYGSAKSATLPKLKFNNGTVRYLCPEHKDISSLTKFDEILKANDMWHVGCFMFMLLTGKDVFDINWREIRRQQDFWNNWKRFITNITQKDVDDEIRRNCYSVSLRDLVRLLESMLMVNPAQRTTAKDALNDLCDIEYSSQEYCNVDIVHKGTTICNVELRRGSKIKKIYNLLNNRICQKIPSANNGYFLKYNRRNVWRVDCDCRLEVVLC